MVVLGAAPVQRAQDTARPTGATIWLLEIDGVINPLSARYLQRQLRAAAEARVSAVVVRLDTPGGLETSMRDMATAVMASPSPVIVYVAPAGARAASAGLFITIAAHVAAMAPGTNIGAAHPVGIGGTTDSVMAGKVVNDAAAFARSLAAEHGRNAQWVEDAVRRSVSITATEAVANDVVDLVARDLDELLRRIDGRSVRTATGDVLLQTTAAHVVQRPMRLHERLLHVLTDPNIAYMLLSIAMLAIMVELYNPGLIVPGVVGVLSLVLALVSFGSLPVNWAGVLLLVLAFGLIIAELMSEGFGVLGVGAIVAFVLGSLMLYEPFAVPSPALPDVHVDRWLIAAMTAAMTAFFAFVVRALLRARRLPVVTGSNALVGRTGTALSELAPRGHVRVDSEVWTALAEDAPLRAGEAVEVAGVEGVTLLVRRPLV